MVDVPRNKSGMPSSDLSRSAADYFESVVPPMHLAMKVGQGMLSDVTLPGFGDLSHGGNDAGSPATTGNAAGKSPVRDR